MINVTRKPSVSETKPRGAHGIINYLDLHLNGVVDNNGILLYEVENLIGAKRYFIHGGIQSVELENTSNKEFFTNKTLLRYLINSHNCDLIKFVSDRHYRFDFIEVDGLMIVYDKTSDGLMTWINGGK